jgi:hypothetical protein
MPASTNASLRGKRAPKKWLATYATGGVLTARVNPRQPADSVILDKDRNRT